MAKRTLNIPIDICIYSVKHGTVGKLQTYCFLKSKCDGHIHDITKVVNEYKSVTGNSERTFFNHKKWLLAEGWLVDLKLGIRVVSFKKVIQSLGIEKPVSTGAIFRYDFKLFKSFVYAAVITYVGRVKRINDIRTGTKTIGGTSERLKYSFRLPHAYLAKYLGIPKTTAQHFRNYAGEFLEVVPELQDFKLAPEQVQEYRKHSDDEAKNLVIMKNKVFEQQASNIWSEVTIKRKKW